MSSNWRPQQKKISKRQVRKKRAVVIGSLVVVFGLALFIAFFVSNLFQVNNLEIEKTKFLNQDSVLSDLNNYFNDQKFLGLVNFRKNIILADKNDFDFLLAKYPEFKDFQIKKNWRTKNLDFSFNERESVGILCVVSQEQCFYFDENLKIFALASEVEGSLVMLINDNSGKVYNLGDNIFVDNNNYFLKIKELINDKFSLLEIKINTEGLVFVLKSNKEFKIDGNDLVESYLGLKALIDNDFDFSKANEYWDLRYLPVVYYK